MKTETVISIAIAIMVFFFNLYLTNVIFGDEDKLSTLFLADVPVAVREARNMAKDRLKMNKFNFKFILGIVFILSALVVKNNFVRDGLALGGILTLTITNIMNWNEFDDVKKLGIISIGLASIIYVGTRVYNNKEWLPTINYVKLL